VAGRHPDIRDNHVRPLASCGLEQRIEVPADRDDLETGLRLEKATETFTDEEAVLGEHEADRHGPRIRR
jgi:hypothetical protein